MNIEDVKIGHLYKSDVNKAWYYVPIKYNGRAYQPFGGYHTWIVIETHDFEKYRVSCLGDSWFDCVGELHEDKEKLEKILAKAYIYFMEQK